MDREVICGLEIHQQLDTRKLFCSCRSDLVEGDGMEFSRRLRPSQSELGRIDPAALMEGEKRLRFRYQAPREVSCLVEADEEPPHAADEQATETVLTIACLLNAEVVDEIHFMRKIVIDGSNTTGFQRTALVAMHGFLEVDGRRISIPTICLEEDAARKVEASGDQVTYRLDRLGIPLVEIATAPDLGSPEEVRKVAQAIGSLLRATGKVKRGIGTIREDLNISIPGGARVEVKGVQELRMLPVFVEKEMQRQRSLLRIRDALRERGVVKVGAEIVDVTDILSSSGSGLVRSSLRGGGRALAVALPGFAGLLKNEEEGFRLGAELAQRARVKGVRGIIHSDELPGYGIEEERVRSIKERLKADAFAICLAPEERARAAMLAVVERANEALEGVPEETRDPQPDGTTVYSRPLPGAERMYPETDVPPITVGKERIDQIMSNLPELPQEKVKRLVATYGIHPQGAQHLVRSGYDEVFERIASSMEGMASVASTLLTNTFPELEREGVDIGSIGEDALMELFELLDQGEFAKEALPDLVRSMVEGRGVREAIEALGLGAVGEEEARKIISSIVAERAHLVIEKEMGAVGPLMGVVMERLRGRIDGRTASEMLREQIERVIRER